MKSNEITASGSIVNLLDSPDVVLQHTFLYPSLYDDTVKIGPKFLDFLHLTEKFRRKGKKNI